MNQLTWDNWYRSEGCRKWMDKTMFAGTSFTNIFYQAMRLIFLDEKGNKGLLYNGNVFSSSQIVVSTNGGRNGFNLSQQQLHLSSGLFHYNTLEAGRLRFEGPDSDDLTKTQYAETSGNAIIDVHFYNIIKHAREGIGAFGPSGPVPENAHGILVLAYFTGAIVLHEIIRNHGFNAKTNASLPQVALQSVLNVASTIFDKDTTLPLSASVNGTPAYGPRWHPWKFMGGQVDTDLGVVAIPGANVIDVYAQTGQTLWKNYWANGQWSGWLPVDPNFDMHPTSSPVAVSAHANHRVIFARKGTNLCTYFKLWDGQQWHPWKLLNGKLEGKMGYNDVSAVIIPGTNVIDVYVRGLDDTLWQKWSTDLGKTWTDWFPVDKSFKLDSSPTAVSANASHRAIYARGKDGNVYHKYWDGQSWHTWENLGGQGIVKGDVAAVAVPGTNITDLYMQGVDGKLWQQYWPNQDRWSGWFPVDKEFPLDSSPVVIATDANHRSIFSKGAPGTNFVYVKHWR